MSELRKQVEALLFSSGKAMHIDDISKILVSDKKKTIAALKDLKDLYSKSDSSLMVTEEGDKWKLNIREQYVSVVTKIVSDTELTKPVLETLAVIAWKSPVLQSEVIKIRSASAYDHISELVDSGFVLKQKEGRSFKLKISDKFLEYFDVPDEGMKEAFGDIKMPDRQPPQPLPEPKAAEEEVEIPEIPPVDENFLSNMESKLSDVSKRNDEVDKDELFKRPQIGEDGEPVEVIDSTEDVEGVVSIEKADENDGVSDVDDVEEVIKKNDNGEMPKVQEEDEDSTEGGNNKSS